MLVVKLTGGLGNQMFQYAIGRYLAIKNNQVLKLDIRGYSGNVADPMRGIREYGLNNFNIKSEIANDIDLMQFDSYFRNNLINKIIRKIFTFYHGNYFKRRYILEPITNYFKFDKNLSNINIIGDIYLEGYWQSEKYFLGIEEVIRHDLTVKDEPSDFNKVIIDQMSNTESVSIHIRHGDNANASAKKHGVLSLDYYHKAIKELSKKVYNPVFYVFSDDPEWAKNNLKINYKTVYISHNSDQKNYEDLRLMTNCRYHIIGNSTFSWWGAWLSPYKDKIVFAPKVYHVDKDISNSDFFPNDWFLI
ncbi:MAG: hypothetical protein COY69_00870 [Candidatus Magasanikbacteria bacterium CG_4_10_14_0_8_um_filter_32_14]|uniref:Alpha-1,2-fucosyltransferase n=1 Tax=Candidatus Magasanikbacteria bacterium CG_4_10_14_0_8_um_filter_32_14 TaxID=1974640 RepID=A0A2M7RAL0_9BACT|nr:MAG: hypothetical protein COY69_00870 [Candidatus Magasanikbacteria bacterium CG_4_10_14_0_8_um_filter_32_14]